MKSLLVVDDDLATLQNIRAQLEGGYRVSLAKSGEQALEICPESRPDLILLDIDMPGMDGFQTMASLKQDPLLRHVPVVFLTGVRDAGTEVRCLEAGAMDFIPKPADPDILRHRIKLHLQLSEYQLRLEHMIKELEDNISITYAELLECKEYNISGHLLRTGAYVGLITAELLRTGAFEGELTPESADMIKRAAPFHDIGKIGVSDIILLKPAALNPEEYAELQKHTVIGGRMLRVIYERTPNRLFLKTAIEIAEGHHECFNGSGYPRGLKGERIPLSCRIMSLANVYDGLITDRVYRKGFPHAEAARIILSERGARFDPRILKTFEALEERFFEIGTSPSFEATGLGRNIRHEAHIDS